MPIDPRQMGGRRLSLQGREQAAQPRLGLQGTHRLRQAPAHIFRFRRRRPDHHRRRRRRRRAFPLLADGGLEQRDAQHAIAHGPAALLPSSLLLLPPAPATAARPSPRPFRTGAPRGPAPCRSPPTGDPPPRGAGAAQRSAGPPAGARGGGARPSRPGGGAPAGGRRPWRAPTTPWPARRRPARAASCPGLPRAECATPGGA